MAAGQDDSLCSVRDRVSRIGRATNDDSVERHTHTQNSNARSSSILFFCFFPECTVWLIPLRITRVRLTIP